MFVELIGQIRPLAQPCVLITQDHLLYFFGMIKLEVGDRGQKIKKDDQSDLSPSQFLGSNVDFVSPQTIAGHRLMRTDAAHIIPWESRGSAPTLTRYDHQQDSGKSGKIIENKTRETAAGTARRNFGCSNQSYSRQMFAYWIVRRVCLVT